MSLLLLFRPRVGTAPLIGCDLAQENGDKLLLEDGGAIVLDGYTCDVVPPTITPGGPRWQHVKQVIAIYADDEDFLIVEVL